MVTDNVMWPSSVCRTYQIFYDLLLICVILSYCATILVDSIAAEVTVVISCDSALSKTHICLSICPCNLYWLFYVFVCTHSPSCTWRGTWPCRSWVIITTFSSLPTFWTSPWALRHFAPSFPLSHTTGNRCVNVCVIPLHPSVLLCIHSYSLHACDVCFHAVGLYWGFSKMEKRIKAHLPLSVLL